MNASDVHPAEVGRKSDPSAASVRDALEAAVDALTAAGVETPRLDAEVLLAEASGWDRARIAARPEAALPGGAGRRFGELVRRRLRREPVAYIVGRKGFRRIELGVDRRVLIPRPETELLVELARELQPRRVLDVGTGSGAVALAIAEELPECEVTATDTSVAALEVARANAARLGLAGRVRFFEGTLPRARRPREGGPEDPDEQAPFDLVVANLPYVSEAEWAALEPEITEWEPSEALLAGPDGLDAIRTFVEALGVASREERLLSREACVALEVGQGQAEAVRALLRKEGFRDVEARRDLAGIERIVWGRR